MIEVSELNYCYFVILPSGPITLRPKQLVSHKESTELLLGTQQISLHSETSLLYIGGFHKDIYNIEYVLNV